MVFDVWRNKLLTCMVHFASETKRPTVMKMFKLLYFLDFRALEELGTPVTNLWYKALERGPVPTELYTEIGKKDAAKIPEDFKDWLGLKPIMDSQDLLLGNEFFARREPEYKWLSKREKTVLQNITEIFKDINANDISMASHERRGPWSITWNKGKGANNLIKFELGLTKVEENKKQLALEGLRERHDLISRHGLVRIA
jgi:uncharacterized phage-associated protein